MAALAVRVAETGKAETIEVSSKNKAIHFRQRFYVWRQAMRDAGWVDAKTGGTTRPEIREAIEGVMLVVRDNKIIMQPQEDPFKDHMKKVWGREEPQEGKTEDGPQPPAREEQPPALNCSPHFLVNHNLGYHDGRPQPDCPLCQGQREGETTQWRVKRLQG